MTGPFLHWEGGHLEGTPWQGIRLVTLELLEEGSSPGIDYRAIVTVWLNQPAMGITRDNVVVTGGRRLADLPYDVAIAGERILLFFRELGDHSLYRVSLVETPTSHARFHPFFSIGEFRFRIDCETGDCRPPTFAATTATGQPPQVDILTKDYNAFVAVLADWVRVHNPHWADLSPASFERMLVELFAHTGDLLSYYQDRVANEAFFDTANQRFSMRQHAALLGETLDEGSAARTVLAFDVTAAGFVPAGLAVKMDAKGDETPVVFTVEERSAVSPQNNGVALVVAAWPGAYDAAIPAGATELFLFGQSNALVVGGRLALQQGAFAQVVTLTGVTEIEQAGWVASPTGTFDPLADPPTPLTRATWQDPLEQAVFPWRQDAPLVIHANLVDAVHGETRRAGFVDSGSRQMVPMSLDRRSSIIARRRTEGPPTLASVRLPDGPVLFDTDAAGQAAPALIVLVDGGSWVRVVHLHASKSFDKHYTADADTDGSLWIGFGDGVRGREIPVARAEGVGAYEPAVPLEFRYRIGDPISGNVDVGTLTKIVRPTTGTDEEASLSALGFATVTNVVPGRGGRQPQSLDKAREMIPAVLKHGRMLRAVSLRDYQDAAVEVSGVARARARALGGVFNSVLVLIDPMDGEMLTPELEDTIAGHIEARRMAGREHFVRPAQYVPLEVALVLCTAPGFVPHLVRDRVLAELRPGTVERPGWFHPNRLSFGDALYVGDLLAFVQGIAGVHAAKVTVFRPLGDLAGSAVRPVIRFGLTEVPRLDDDTDFPENGTLDVEILGLDAAASIFDVDFAAGASA